MRTELPEAPIVREILTKLATELNEPRITPGLAVDPTDKDFDNREFSILDQSDRRIVVKVAEDNLHHYHSTPEVSTTVYARHFAQTTPRSITGLSYHSSPREKPFDRGNRNL
jgi:hypothetical protein